MEVNAKIQVQEDVAASSSSASVPTYGQAKTPGFKLMLRAPVQFEERQTDTLKGKGLFAVSAIPRNTLIFEEDPLVFCQFSWKATQRNVACDHCLGSLELIKTNLRRLTKGKNFILLYPRAGQTDRSRHKSCPKCKITYCSKNCLEAAYQEYHKELCCPSPDVSTILNYDRIRRSSCRKTTMLLLIRLLVRIIQAPNKQEMVQKILNFYHGSTKEHEEFSRQFLGDKFEERLNELRELVSMVVQAELHPEVQQFLTFEGFQTLIALIEINLQWLTTSPLFTWREAVFTTSLSEERRKDICIQLLAVIDELEKYPGLDHCDNEGGGLYSKRSSVNHSCDPNATIELLKHNSRIFLVARKNIEPGEEICFSYLNYQSFLKRSRHSRQKILKEKYLFTCICPKCMSQSEDPDVTTSEEDISESE